jgi:hypothetical protein
MNIPQKKSSVCILLITNTETHKYLVAIVERIVFYMETGDNNMSNLHPSLYRYNYQASTSTETWVTIPLDYWEAKRMINQGLSLSIIKNDLYLKNRALIESYKQSLKNQSREGVDK